MKMKKAKGGSTVKWFFSVNIGPLNHFFITVCIQPVWNVLHLLPFTLSQTILHLYLCSSPVTLFLASGLWWNELPSLVHRSERRNLLDQTLSPGLIGSVSTPVLKHQFFGHWDLARRTQFGSFGKTGTLSSLNPQEEALSSSVWQTAPFPRSPSFPSVCYHQAVSGRIGL